MGISRVAALNLPLLGRQERFILFCLCFGRREGNLETLVVGFLDAAIMMAFSNLEVVKSMCALLDF
jgi:hypothetical protein